MILEHALLRVRPEDHAAYEQALEQAIPLIAGARGFRGIEIRKAVEQAGLYLLLVRWDDIASHRDGFRRSSEYSHWRDLLHGFYEPMPEVAYFGDPVVKQGPA